MASELPPPDDLGGACDGGLAWDRLRASSLTSAGTVVARRSRRVLFLLVVAVGAGVLLAGCAPSALPAVEDEEGPITRLWTGEVLGDVSDVAWIDSARVQVLVRRERFPTLGGDPTSHVQTFSNAGIELKVGPVQRVTDSENAPIPSRGLRSVQTAWRPDGKGLARLEGWGDGSWTIRLVSLPDYRETHRLSGETLFGHKLEHGTLAYAGVGTSLWVATGGDYAPGGEGRATVAIRLDATDLSLQGSVEVDQPDVGLRTTVGPAGLLEFEQAADGLRLVALISSQASSQAQPEGLRTRDFLHAINLEAGRPTFEPYEVPINRDQGCQREVDWFRVSKDGSTTLVHLVGCNSSEDRAFEVYDNALRARLVQFGAGVPRPWGVAGRCRCAEHEGEISPDGRYLVSVRPSSSPP